MCSGMHFILGIVVLIAFSAEVSLGKLRNSDKSVAETKQSSSERRRKLHFQYYS